MRQKQQSQRKRKKSTNSKSKKKILGNTGIGLGRRPLTIGSCETNGLTTRPRCRVYSSILI